MMIELLVEEPSMEAFVQAYLPRALPRLVFDVHAFQGKHDLLAKLEDRLRGYASWITNEMRIIVVVDRDEQDCVALKQHLEEVAVRARLKSRTMAGAGKWNLVNRIAVEELEAWYFGDWDAVCAAFPRVSAKAANKKTLRDVDAIAGGTWEAFERILKSHNYYRNGLAKVDAARRIGAHFDPVRCKSTSFRIFHAALVEAAAD